MTSKAGVHDACLLIRLEMGNEKLASTVTVRNKTMSGTLGTFNQSNSCGGGFLRLSIASFAFKFCNNRGMSISANDAILYAIS